MTTSSAEQRIASFFGMTCNGTDLYDLVPVPNSTYVLNGKVIELGPGWRMFILPYADAFARWKSRQNPAVLAELHNAAQEDRLTDMNRLTSLPAGAILDS